MSCAIVNGGAAIAMLSGFEAVRFPLSVTVTVKFAVPAAVGVPLDRSRGAQSQAGGERSALTVHEFPRCRRSRQRLRVCRSDRASGSDAVVIDRGGTVIAMLSGFDAVRLPLSVTVTVKFDVPPAVGVPLMSPPALRVKPAGRSADDCPRVSAAAPVAVSVCEYAVPNVPPGQRPRGDRQRGWIDRNLVRLRVSRAVLIRDLHGKAEIAWRGRAPADGALCGIDAQSVRAVSRR